MTVWRASLLVGVMLAVQLSAQLRVRPVDLEDGSVGLGLTTSIFTALSDRKLDQQITAAGIPLTDSKSDAAHGILGGTQSGLQVQQQFPDVAGEIERFVREAFVTGFDWAFRVDAILAFVGVAVAAAFVGDRLHRRDIPHGTFTRFAAVGGAIEGRVSRGLHHRR